MWKIVKNSQWNIDEILLNQKYFVLFFNKKNVKIIEKSQKMENMRAHYAEAQVFVFKIGKM